MKTKKYASNLAIWQKLLLVLCAAMVNLLPASSAAAADDA